MEYVLLGTLFLGILLFAIGWLMVAMAGFQRHPVTGLFALIPGINIITLPSLWHRVSGWAITGFVGILLATGAWLGGAKNNLYQQAQVLGANIAVIPPVPNTPQPPSATAVVPTKPAAPVVTTTPLALPSATASQTAAPVATTAPIPTTPAPTVAAAALPVPALPPTEDLPRSALYQITFENLPVDKLAESDSKYVSIVQKDGRRREGKIHIGTAGAISLEEREGSGLVAHPIKANDIRTLSVMTHKQDND